MEEKREFVRLDLNVKVDWKRIGETSGPTAEFTNETKNISAGGICLVVNEKLGAGEELQIGMELPSGKIIDVKGRVVWISEYEIFGREHEKIYDVGIEFMNISKKEREEINEFVLASFSSKKE
jgi:c-di-GMP-binding flagellar brake protein YcgR